MGETKNGMPFRHPVNLKRNLQMALEDRGLQTDTSSNKVQLALGPGITVVIVSLVDRHPYTGEYDAQQDRSVDSFATHYAGKRSRSITLITLVLEGERS